MVRPVPWDEMPRHYAPNKKDIAAKVEAKPVEVEVRSFESDLKSIGMRTAFGLVVELSQQVFICKSTLTHNEPGSVEVLRDVKAMTIDRKITTMKILRVASIGGGFFGGYHALRRTLHLYFPQPSWEDNIVLAGSISLIPIIMAAPARHFLPYAVMMIALDGFNEYNDQSK